MPKFVASIDVYFDASDAAEAGEFADDLADLVLVGDLVHMGVTAVTSGVAPVPEPA